MTIKGRLLSSTTTVKRKILTSANSRRNQFSGDIYYIFARNWITIVSSNSANISVSKIVDETNFWNQIFGGLGFHHLGFFESRGRYPKKHPFATFTFHR